MNITLLLSDFLVQLTMGFIMVLVSKALFEESVVIDTINIILLFVGSGIIALFDVLAESGFSKIWKYLSYSSFILLFVIFFRGVKKNRWKRIKAVITSYFTYVIAISLYCFLLVTILNPTYLLDDVELDNNIMIIMHICDSTVCIIISLYIYFELVKKGICLSYKLKEKILMILFEAAVLAWFIVLFDAYDNGTYQVIPQKYKYGMMFFVSVMFFGANLFLVKNKLAVYYRAGQKYQQEMLDLELKHFKQYKESQEETKRFRHDIINNLMAIQMLQADGKSDKAAEYVNELLGMVSGLSPKVVTGNDFLDSIISAKLETMEELGIKYEIDGVFDKGLNLNLVDICTIFSNALDNAIEACELLDSDRYFRMKIKRTSAFYMIEMENSMAKETDVTDILTSRRFTTKKNKELHGYGVSNIKNTVEKYNGETMIDMKNDTFVLTIMLPVT